MPGKSVLEDFGLSSEVGKGEETSQEVKNIFYFSKSFVKKLWLIDSNYDIN
jgi:hypothetical protein